MYINPFKLAFTKAVAERPKDAIEREARAAAKAGTPLRDACFYPFDSEAGRHFTAVYLLSLGA